MENKMIQGTFNGDVYEFHAALVAQGLTNVMFLVSVDPGFDGAVLRLMIGSRDVGIAQVRKGTTTYEYEYNSAFLAK